MNIFYRLLCISLCIAGISPDVSAQENTDREQELMTDIGRLDERTVRERIRVPQMAYDPHPDKHFRRWHDRRSASDDNSSDLRFHHNSFEKNRSGSFFSYDEDKRMVSIEMDFFRLWTGTCSAVHFNDCDRSCFRTPF